MVGFAYKSCCSFHFNAIPKTSVYARKKYFIWWFRCYVLRYFYVISINRVIITAVCFNYSEYVSYIKD